MQNQQTNTATLVPGSHDHTRRENTITFIVCVLVAILVWFYVMSIDSPTSTETYSSVAVTVVNDRGDTDNALTAISGTNSVIEVTLKGRKSVLNSLKAEDIEAYVDVSKTNVSGKGVYTVSLEAPAGTVIEDYYPKEISVFMDKRGIINVPVECRLSDYTITSNYSLNVSAPSALSVDAIQVSGPESELANIDHARMTLSPGTITQSFSGTGPLELVDRDGNVINSKYLSMSVSEATASYSVLTTKKIPLTVQYKYDYFSKNGTTVKVTPGQIEIKGAVEKLQDLNSLVVATIDETKIVDSGTHGYDLDLPEGITLVDAEGQDSVSVDIRFNATTIKEITVPAEMIEIINVPSGKRATLMTDSLIVRVRGRNLTIKELTEADVTVIADVSLATANGEQFIGAKVSLKTEEDANSYIVGEYSVAIQMDDEK